MRCSIRTAGAGYVTSCKNSCIDFRALCRLLEVLVTPSNTLNTHTLCGSKCLNTHTLDHFATSSLHLLKCCLLFFLAINIGWKKRLWKIPPQSSHLHNKVYNIPRGLVSVTYPPKEWIIGGRLGWGVSFLQIQFVVEPFEIASVDATFLSHHLMSHHLVSHNSSIEVLLASHNLMSPLTIWVNSLFIRGRRASWDTLQRFIFIHGDCGEWLKYNLN